MRDNPQDPSTAQVSWLLGTRIAQTILASDPLDRDGNYGIFFASWQVESIESTNGEPVSDVSEQVSAMSRVQTMRG
ncbi:hypothetical protein ACVW1C_005491 [Bradyrhizobium sp. USDA 4011]